MRRLIILGIITLSLTFVIWMAAHHVAALVGMGATADILMLPTEATP
jgi:hypothetical protein